MPVSAQQTAFNLAYWAAQLPEVSALRNIDDEGERTGRAVILAAKGFVIDRELHCYLWDPYIVMSIREAAGYTWVPSLLMNKLMPAPGVHILTLPDYDPLNPPAGSIKVSTNVLDYPAYVAPAPPKPVDSSSSSPVGAHNIANLYFVKPWDTNPDGAIVTETRGRFMKHVMNPGSMFQSQWYELLS